MEKVKREVNRAIRDKLTRRMKCTTGGLRKSRGFSFLECRNLSVGGRSRRDALAEIPNLRATSEVWLKKEGK